jgi:hypothetical protein
LAHDLPVAVSKTVPSEKGPLLRVLRYSELARISHYSFGMNAAASNNPMNADLDPATAFATCFTFQGEYCEVEHTNLPAAMKLRSELADSKLVTNLKTWSVRKGDFI